MTRRSLLVTLGACALVATCGGGGAQPQDVGGVASVEEEDEPLTRRHLPTECRHLYNVGRSREWQDCMGVGPKE